MSNVKLHSDLPRVIVRAWGDEPVVLVAHGLEKVANRVLVGQARAKHPISLPADDVFDYEERRFTRLLKAYSTGDFQRLRALYDEIRQNKNVKEPCNRYRNMIPLVHEEKPKVANARSAAQSHGQ